MMLPAISLSSTFDSIINIVKIDPDIYFESSWAIMLIIPSVIILILLARKDFVKLDDDFLARKRRQKLLWMVTILRILAVTLVLIAAAVPYKTRYSDFEGDPVVNVIIDKSGSMEIYEFDAEKFTEKIKDRTNANIQVFGDKEKSNIGEALISKIEPYGSIIVVSDGNSNLGPSLGDLAVVANSVNATVNAITLSNKRNDLSVKIIGSSKTSEGLDESYIIAVDGVGIDSYDLLVSVDGDPVINKKTSERITELKRSFTKGYHVIEAKILTNDHFTNNNVFYKTIKVVERPSLFYLTSNAQPPMADLYSQVFRITKGDKLPEKLDNYYAVVIDDQKFESLKPYSDKLTGYVADGNGLMVVGGKSSYEHGEYKDSPFEILLPVFVASAGKKASENSVVILIDISGSTGTNFGDSSAVDVEKALAVNVFNNLAPNTQLSVIAFNTQSFLISEPSYVAEKTDYVDKVSRLIDGGGTRIGVGLASAVKLLKNQQGSKSIILISDGKTQAPQETLDTVSTAAEEGIKIYTVGVGEKTNTELMNQIAASSGGIYFRATDSSSLKLIFGDFEEQERKNSQLGIVVLDKNHFITDGYEPKASITGFNQVVPKETSKLLITTVVGDPILTVWRLGLGKVAALSTDDGSSWAPELLNKENSQLLVKTINWLVGDPDRKNTDTVTTFDTRVNEDSEIIVKGNNPGGDYKKVDENTYSKSFTPAQIGVYQELGAKYAVNYAKEYEKIGQGQELETLVRSTGGKFFNENDIDNMIEYTKTKTKRQIMNKEPKTLLFAGAALVIFLIELYLRRLYKKI